MSSNHSRREEREIREGGRLDQGDMGAPVTLPGPHQGTLSYRGAAAKMNGGLCLPHIHGSFAAVSPGSCGQEGAAAGGGMWEHGCGSFYPVFGRME